MRDIHPRMISNLA